MLTRFLVERALDTRHDVLPADVRTVARDCLVDWLGCAFAALGEPVSEIIADSAREEGGNAQATMLGHPWRGTLAQAALVNGTVSHALDYDDVNLSVPGHMSVAILPALLALAEHRGCSPVDVITAFVAGYEFACAVGVLVEPAHYANGFHATATIGCLGAAMASAHLLELPTLQACHAVGIAATQAAGLKAMFGSMAKPLHAGLAAQAGLRAASLAKKGFVSRPDILECKQGFAKVHGADFHLERAVSAPESGFHILNNLFKFHAACYSTHSTIEAIALLRHAHGIDANAVSRIDIVAGEGCSICNIQNPATALEAKFSLRATAAFAMLGIDTGSLQTWDRVTDPLVAAMLERVEVKLVPGMSLSDAAVTVVHGDGKQATMTYDCGQPIADKAAQSAKVFKKFAAISQHVLGDVRMKRILVMLESFEHQDNVLGLMRLCGEPPVDPQRG
ncbi:MmgE/PrpD family protein [Bordetella sp. BOR01]|uniref:MmgE/PrpD family protein n=1 Tax=Bordetella sp. BOR01 TaxID=2854779 RepID=UPI001C45367A|nr:MmgE/PrpD family protein [Bordetella sp. BOR01]MBV7484202.1 MmgE/PrpD family protein [Bordetella sp. BOR01]